MWNQIKNKLRLFGYICLFIAAVFAFLYFRSRSSLIILFILFIMPVCSYMVAINQREALEISIKPANGKIYANDTAYFIISLNNPHPFPLMKVAMNIIISNPFMDSKGELQAVMGAVGRKTEKLSLPLTVNDIGIVRVDIADIRLFDFLGIFSFSVSDYKYAYANRVSVLPKVTPESEEFFNSFRVGFLESEESTMKGSDFSEVSDLRQYIPGDRLKDIHWKASAKRQEIMVKERVSLSQSQLVLVPDLVCESSKRRLVIEKTFSVCLGLFARETAVMLLWGSKEHGYATESVWSVSELENGIEKIFLEKEYVSGEDAFRMYKGRYPMLESCMLVKSEGDGVKIRVFEG